MDSKKYTTSELIKRFLPYFRPYYKTLFTDLFCAALTTICEIILPLIIRQITNTALQDVALLTTKMIAGLGFLYFILRIVSPIIIWQMSDMSWEQR